MPLPDKLRNDMYSESLDESVKPAVPTRNVPPVPPAAPAPEPVFTPVPNPVPTPAAAPAPVPTPRPVPMPESTPAQAPSAVMDQLASIERRLCDLNEQMGDLGASISAYQDKAMDPEPLWTKIGNVHTDVKRLMSDLKQQAQVPQPEDRTDDLLSQLLALTEKQDKTERMLTQALRENATFQQQVRRGMQHDLDELREQLSGTPFNPILKEIATMYSSHHSILSDADIPQKSLRELRDLFERMEDLLFDYGAEITTSNIGDVRPKNQCKIIEKIPTGDESKHNTIAKSRRPGIIRDRLVLCHETVDVYVYDPSLKSPPEPTPVPEQTTEPIPDTDNVSRPADACAFPDLPVISDSE